MRRKLLSRKLWVAVLSAGAAAVAGHYQEAAAIVVAYIVGETAVDAAAASRK